MSRTSRAPRRGSGWPSPRERSQCSEVGRAQRGVVALEFALLVPVVALLLLAVLLAGVHALDQLTVQDAAAAGARAAATSRDDRSAREAVDEVLDGRPAWVVVSPARRRPGDRVVVRVTRTRDVGWLTWTVIGEATATTEPGA